MCEAGRILHHLSHSVEDENNIVLITGYQAQHTLGRRIVEKSEKIKIFGDEYTLSAEVEVINALSAHADREGLLEALKQMGPQVEKVFIVHGDEDANESLAGEITNMKTGGVIIPEPGEKFEV